MLSTMITVVMLSQVSVSDADVRQAVERSLPFLEEGGVRWMQERGCVSCHHVPFMIWSHVDARSLGMRIDDDKLERWTDQAFVSMLAQRKEGGGADSMSQMLLGRDRASRWRKKPPRHFKTSDPYDTMFEMLLDRQKEDGSWPPEGQLSTPPSLTTRWALLALQSREDTEGDPGAGLDPDDHMASPLTEKIRSIEARLPESRKRGRAYLASVAPHETNESHVLRAVLERTKEEDSVAALLARQNADGGWSNLSANTASDAYATGQTLYGLSLLGVQPDHPAIARARTFLARTQGDDGSWTVPAERIREGAKRGAVDEVFSYWGTAWAAIGLMRTLPD